MDPRSRPLITLVGLTYIFQITARNAHQRRKKNALRGGSEAEQRRFVTDAIYTMAARQLKERCAVGTGDS